MEPIKRKAGRPAANNEAEKPGPTLKLTPEADRLLTAHATKLKKSKRQYASAAIRFFAETGLDPTADRSEALATISAKLGAVDKAIRQQNVDIGNCLIAIIRGWEKNQYAFLQQQQMSLHTYLEQIEVNLLQHLVTVEAKMLTPVVEQLFKVHVEVGTIRGLATRLFIEATKKADSKPSAERYQAQKQQLDGEHEQMLFTLLTEFLKTNLVPKPQATPKRAVTPVPPKPAAPAPAAPGHAPAATPKT
jgi:hypothetical protein